MLLSAALSLASPRGHAGKLSVLIFHRVLPRQDPLFPHEIDAAQFERICTWLRRGCCAVRRARFTLPEAWTVFVERGMQMTLAALRVLLPFTASHPALRLAGRGETKSKSGHGRYEREQQNGDRSPHCCVLPAHRVELPL